MADGGRARILLREAPAVLSTAQVLALSEACGAKELREGLLAALDRRRRSHAVVHALAALLSAAFDRAALMIANDEDPATCRAAMDIVGDSLETWKAAAPARRRRRAVV